MSQAGHCTVVMFRALSNQGGDKTPRRKRRKIRSRHRRAGYPVPVLDLSSCIILGEKNLSLTTTSSTVILGRKKSLPPQKLNKPEQDFGDSEISPAYNSLHNCNIWNTQEPVSRHMPTSSTLGSLNLLNQRHCAGILVQRYKKGKLQ